jgi:hypothetical protein
MQLKPRFLTLALGLALAPFAAQAQDIELVTEATVTFQVVFGTSVTTTNGSVGVARIDTTRAYNSTITTPDIIRNLLIRLTADTDEPVSDITGWRLAAVRPSAADYDAYVVPRFALFYAADIDTKFYLYLVNDTLNRRILVPEDIFLITPNTSVLNSTVTHSTRNIIAGRGVATNSAEMFFTPSFTRKELPATITGPFTENVGGTNRSYNISTKTESTYTLDTLNTSGFSTIAFGTRTNEPVFYFAIESLRFNARGDFTGNLINTTTAVKKFTTRGIPDETISTTVDPEPTPSGGLVSFQVVVSACKLVPRDLYPEVPFYAFGSYLNLPEIPEFPEDPEIP